MQMAMVLTSQKPTQRNRLGEVPEGLPGSTLERGRREEKRQELERSSPAPHTRQGEPTKRRSSDSGEGVRSTRSTRRMGKPSTWGRGGQKYAAFKGNMGRTRKAGQTMPTSL